MSNLSYVYSGEAWDKFRVDYLMKKSFCEVCENKGKLSTAIIVYQPTPEADKKKTKYTQYNVQALCSECYMSILTDKAIRSVLVKLVELTFVLVGAALLIFIITLIF